MRLRNNGIITDREYVGKSLEEAIKYAEDGGFTTRIVEQNGIPLMLDMTSRADRLNFRVIKIEDVETVTDVFGG